MAFYKYAAVLTHVDNQHYDTLHGVSALTPFSGIYRCTGCGQSAVSTRGHPLPPENHHQHAPMHGPIQWQLIVAAHLP